MMKKLSLVVLFVGLLVPFSSAIGGGINQITMCVTHNFFGVDREINCSGHFTGKTTMRQLAEAGWEFKGDIARAESFIVIFQR